MPVPVRSSWCHPSEASPSNVSSSATPARLILVSPYSKATSVRPVSVVLVRLILVLPWRGHPSASWAQLGQVRPSWCGYPGAIPAWLVPVPPFQQSPPSMVSPGATILARPSWCHYLMAVLGACKLPPGWPPDWDIGTRASFEGCGSLHSPVSLAWWHLWGQSLH